MMPVDPPPPPYIPVGGSEGDQPRDRVRGVPRGPLIPAMSATIRRVARPREVLSAATLADLKYRKNRVELAERSYRISVLAALDEGSFAEVSKATGLSTNTLQRWKREAGE